jgi:type VI secretion system secreted protein Hcp
MPADLFLKLTGIEGESKDARHQNEIDVESFSWGLANSGTVVGTATGGKATFQDISFTMLLNKASPKLFLYCASGKHIPEATLFVREVGGDQQEYYQVSFKDCLVTSYQQGGSEGSDRPVDSFSLNFAQIKVSYKEQKEDGSLDTAVEAGWDLKSNKEV